ncbi:hypothetical protein UFOVP699_259 [uncultured Caudovirales phage]|uniref:Uncharacterized protein n=1 Tax=uncultured Caudovirales phage TaxID=2100421 RepID=A0A6J5NKV4_9CAUD|nr:hypothetical protein UFOVP699_259 [uncultured Caudovirales phage]
MPTKYTLKFSQYIKESEEITSSKLRGYSSEEIVDRINGKDDSESGKTENGLKHVFPDKLKFGIPSDNLGRAVTYRDANGTIQRILDITNYYQSKGEDVTFYCWSIAFDGSPEVTDALRNKIKEFDSGEGFGSPRNINLKKVIEYFSQNKEDADNIASLSIGIDAKSIRKELKKAEMSQEEPTQPVQPTQTDQPGQM